MLNKINRYNSSSKVGLKENEIQTVCLNFTLSETFLFLLYLNMK